MIPFYDSKCTYVIELKKESLSIKTRNNCLT